jgi:hypothetical protein
MVKMVKFYIVQMNNGSLDAMDRWQQRFIEALKNNRLTKNWSLLSKSRKKHTITPQDRKLTDPRSALDLCCVNHSAMLRWSRAFYREFAMFFGLHDQNTYPDQPLFFVTLTDVFVRQITMHRGSTSTTSRENFKPG